MPRKDLPEIQSEHVVRDAVARTLAVVGLASVALIHLLDAHDTFVAAPYKGWLYVGLIGGSLTTAAVLARRSDPRAWLAALLLPLGAFVAFVYSRTVGLPNGADDIGNWWEPLGLASLFVEGALVVLAAAVLSERDRALSNPRQRVSVPRPQLERGVR
jgi:hypothetical protein